MPFAKLLIATLTFEIRFRKNNFTNQLLIRFFICHAQFPRSIKKSLLMPTKINEPESFLLHLRSTLTCFIEPLETFEVWNNST